jgi:hypothetical protein
MGHDWIIDVLADLKSFASTNDLPLLALQLEETALLASAEIDKTTETPSRLTRGNGSGTQYVFASTGASRRA